MNDTPTQFADLKLDPKVLQAITEAGYTTPTPIQLGAIPPALEGRDVLGIAQTGTGKTAGFTLPMITLLGRGRARARMPRSLVLCPTRELAAQVAENFDTYSKHTRLTKALLIGGVSFGEQDKLIDRGVDVLIATPGRLLDHFERGKLLLTGVQIMVVDEADRMLDMGFIPDIERIFQLTPFTRQTLFFSATMAPEIERITDTFLHAPARIEVARQATASETITQKLLEITPTRKDQTAKQKRELLRAMIESEGAALKNAIIFCNRKTEVDVVAKSLKAHGYDAAPIHGDLDQSQRTRTLEGFREGTLRFLVASDVAARGLDIPAVSHVFNFDLPSHAEDYVHRIGRTGRAGLEGTAISLGVPADEKYLAAIEGLLKKSLPRAPLPEGFSLSEAAQAAPRAQPERNGRDGGRSRSRSGRDRREERASDTHAQADARGARDTRPDAKAAAADSKPGETQAAREPRNDAPAKQVETARRDERRGSPRDAKPEHRPEPRRDDRAEDGSGDRRRNDRRDDRRPGAVGLGEHVPDFLTRSFRTTAPVSSENDGATNNESAAAPVTSDTTPKTSGKSTRSRSRGGRKPSADRASTVEATDVKDKAEAAKAEPAEQKQDPAHSDGATSAAEPTTVAPVAASEPAVASEAETAPAKPARAPRARRAPKPKTPDADAAAAVGDAPTSDAAGEPKPKAPARTRRKPAVPKDPDTAVAAEGDAPRAPAPRRTRTRKATAKHAADPDAAIAPAPDPSATRDEA